MYSLEFNYLHDLATANYDLDNRPDPDSESIILKEDLLEAFWGPQTNEARVSAEKNYGCGSFRDIEVPSGAKRFCSPWTTLAQACTGLKITIQNTGLTPRRQTPAFARSLKKVESLEATSCSHEEATAGRTRR